jgi:hypothetical protein
MSWTELISLLKKAKENDGTQRSPKHTDKEIYEVFIECYPNGLHGMNPKGSFPMKEKKIENSA